MTRTFKGFPICEKHGITYRYQEGCLKCKREKPKPKEKPLDKALREMEEKGLIPKIEKEELCDFCQKNEAMKGHSYRFKPICHDCCYSNSRRYKKHYDKNNDNDI